MTTENPNAPVNPPPHPSRARRTGWFIAILVLVAIASAGIAALLVTIIRNKEAAKYSWVRKVEVTDATTDPEPWGINWPFEYDAYKRTVEPSKTNFGGGDAPAAAEKAERYPWLTTMFAGYAFSLDYRDRRGHAYMLLDQEKTRRVLERPQPGACLHCHASVIPTYRRLGSGNSDWEKVHSGFVELGKKPYKEALAEVVKTGSSNPVTVDGKQEMKRVDGAHPVSCVDCHDPNTMDVRVTRPGFIIGIKELKKHQGINDYDPNRDATRQEMRSYVCAQCHVEYYCGPKVTLLFPWGNGLKVQEIEAYYDSYKFPDGHRFFDWQHPATGAELLKAQHPEFEMWSQGIHARSGVSCADCHMPYVRRGAMKVSDHYIRSPLLNVNNACQVCHHYSEDEIKSRVADIQNTNFNLLQQAGKATAEMIAAIKECRDAGASEQQLAPALALHRSGQWRLDFVAAENSMGFHAPQEAARILGESIDMARQAQLLAVKLRATLPTTRPSTGPAR